MANTNTNYGHYREIVNYPPANREMIELSRYVITEAFKRNYELLQQVNKSTKVQVMELNSIYSLRISLTTMSELKNGKRFKCGILLLMTIKHYWLVKGYDFRIDL